MDQRKPGVSNWESWTDLSGVAKRFMPGVQGGLELGMQLAIHVLFGTGVARNVMEEIIGADLSIVV
jgi:hypothetical protein